MTELCLYPHIFWKIIWEWLTRHLAGFPVESVEGLDSSWMLQRHEVIIKPNKTRTSQTWVVHTVRSEQGYLEQNTTPRKADSPLDKTIVPDMSYQHNHPSQQRPGINMGILPIETLPHWTKANSTEWMKSENILFHILKTKVSSNGGGDSEALGLLFPFLPQSKGATLPSPHTVKGTQA